MKNPWNRVNEETVSLFVNRKNFKNIKIAETAEDEEKYINDPDWKYMGMFNVNSETMEVIR